MTNGQTSGSGTPMQEAAENAGGVSGMMNLTVNLPDNVRISTVDTDQEETTVSNGNTTGMIQIYAGSTAPEGWLLCNGAAVSRATYADLFAVIGTVYGLGNANTTFNLPDLRGRFPLGVDNMGEVSANRVVDSEATILGGASGESRVALQESELPPHAHDVLVGSTSSPGSDPGEDERANGVGAGGSSRIIGFAFGRSGDPDDRYPRYERRSRSGNRVYDSRGFPNFIQGGGGTDRHYNIPPYLSLNYIIKT